MTYNPFQRLQNLELMSLPSTKRPRHPMVHSKRITREFTHLEALSGAVSYLPMDVRKQALKVYRQFEADPSHPGLNFKLINSKLGLWSARVNNDYRVLGTRSGADILSIWIGTHADYEKVIGRR